MLKIKGCTDEECAMLEKTVQVDDYLLWRTKDLGLELTNTGIAFVYGLRAAPKSEMSDEAKAVLEAAVDWDNASRFNHGDLPDKRITLRSAAACYRATLAPPVDIEKLKHRKSELGADCMRNIEAGTWNTAMFNDYNEACRTHAAATAPRKPTRGELAEKVCLAMRDYVNKGHEYPLSNVLTAYEAWEAA